MKLGKSIVFIILILIFALGLFFFPVPSGQAYFAPTPKFSIPKISIPISIGGMKPFGGKINKSIECDTMCGEQKTLLYIDGKQYLKTQQTKIYKNNNPNIGSWVLGLAETSTQDCQKYIMMMCITIGSGYPIKFMGTS